MFSFEKVIESWRSIRLLIDLELTNHNTRNQSVIFCRSLPLSLDKHKPSKNDQELLDYGIWEVN